MLPTIMSPPAIKDFSGISFPTDERAVAVTIAAARSSGDLVRAVAEVFQASPTPKPKARRRPSISKIMKNAKEQGFDIAIAPDGTTKLIAGQDSESSKNWWDEKLK